MTIAEKVYQNRYNKSKDMLEELKCYITEELTKKGSTPIYFSDKEEKVLNIDTTRKESPCIIQDKYRETVTAFLKREGVACFGSRKFGGRSYVRCYFEGAL